MAEQKSLDVKAVMARLGDWNWPEIGPKLLDVLRDVSGCENAIIGLVDPDTAPAYVVEVAVASGTDVQVGMRYPLAGTPCEDVSNSMSCTVPSDVARRYPEDVWLADNAMQSYLGAPLFDGQGAFMGVLVCLGKQSLEVEQARHWQNLMNMLAGRLSASMVREQLLKELSEKSGLHKVALRLAGQGVWQWDVARGELVWDDELRRIYEVPPDEVPSYDSWLERLHPEDRPQVGNRIQRALQFGEDWEIVERVNVRGHWKTLATAGHVLRDEAGQVRCLMGVCQDVTADQEMRISLAHERQRLDLALDISEVGVWEWHVQPDVLTWDARMGQLFHRAVDQPMSVAVFTECLHPDDLPGTWEKVQNSIKTGEKYEATYRVAQPDGSWRWIEAHGRAVLDDKGEAERLIGVCRDVHDARVQERRLRRERERLNMVVGMVEAGTIVLDAETMTIDVDMRAASLFGGQPEDFAHVRDLQACMHPDDAVRMQQELQQALKDGSKPATMRRVKDGAGGWRWIESVGRLGRQGDGTSEEFQVMVRDVTAQVTHQQAIEALNVELEDRVTQRTTELSVERERLVLSLESAGMGVWEVDLAHTEPANLLTDARIRRLFDLASDDEMQTLDVIWERIHPEDTARMQVALAEASEGKKLDHAFRVIHRDGRVRHLRVAGRLLGNESGACRIIGVNWDITDLVDARELVAEERTRLSLGLEAGCMGVWDWHLDKTGPESLIWDRRMYEMMGMKPFPKDWQGVEDFAELIPEGERERAFAVAQQVIERGEGRFYTEFRIRREDTGELRHIAAAGRLLMTPAGESRRIIGVNWDITERVRQQQQLRWQKVQLDLALDAAGMGIWTWYPQREGPDGLEMSARCHEMLCTHPDNWHGPGDSRMHVHMDDQSRLVEASTKAFETGGVLRETFRVCVPDSDEVRHVVTAARMMEVGPDEEPRMMGVNWEITDLVNAREKAEAASLSKSSFLANMSHEIRTPLNAVLGFSQVLEEADDIPDTHREQVTGIRHAGEHLLSLINDVLAMSKIESGQVELNLAPFSVAELAEALRLMFRQRARERNVAWEVQVASDVPPWLEGDAGKLRQVMVNLIGNAFKFTRKGHVICRIGLAETLPNGQLRLGVEIEDTGCGLSKADRARIFQPFIQAHNQRGAGDGTGLGLSISQYFVRMMSGELDVRSELKQGSVFHFTVLTQIARAPDPSDTGLGMPAMAEQLASLEGLRVLAVDDVPMNRRVLKLMLEPLGCTVDEAGDGREALDKLQQAEYGIVLMDMRMPVMDGETAVRAMRDQGNATPVLAVTASAMEEAQVNMIDSGVDEIVRKPFAKKELVTAVLRRARKGAL